MHFYLDMDVDNVFFVECVRALQRGVALEIFFSDTQIGRIEEAPFTLNKIFELKAKGASIYNVHSAQFKGIRCLCQIDFSNSWIVREDGEYEEVSEPIYENKLMKLSGDSSEYRKADGDISVEFNSENNIVFEGKTTNISWNVANADSVVVSGLGKVASNGSVSIQISTDTILVLKATNSKGVKYKAIQLKAVQGVSIDYDLQFLNPASKEFVSLKSEDNYEGVFGVAKGYKVRFEWNVANAEHVTIKPFDLEQSKGDHVFMPDGTIEIRIQANLQGKTTTKRIIVHEFPMPVFTQKLVNIEKDFNSIAQFELQDFRQKAYDFIDSQGLSDTWKSTEELREKMKNQEHELLQVYDKLKFEDFYANHSIEKLNRSIIDRLKAYFSDQPKVLDMIKTLNQYNNE